MGLETLTVRPFVPEDAIAIEGGVLDTATVGNTVVIDDEPVAYAGVYKLNAYPGRPGYDFCFFHISDCARGKLLREKAPLFVTRIVRDALLALKSEGMRQVYVFSDPTIPKSEALLETLGFERMVGPGRDPNFELQVISAHLGRDIWVKVLNP